MSSSGLHVHHAVPGILLLVVGAVTAIATDTDTRWSALAAVLVGVGTSLVLDEFALILHLEDVYWAEEGRISVEMVSLAVASMGLVLVGFTPFDLSQEDSAALSVTLVGFGLHLVWIVVCVSKGKYKMAFFGVFFTIVALIGAWRLARPGFELGAPSIRPGQARSSHGTCRSVRRPRRAGIGLGQRLRRRQAVRAGPGAATLTGRADGLAPGSDNVRPVRERNLSSPVRQLVMRI